MSIILSLSHNGDGLYAAGPEGMFRVRDAGALEDVIQPQKFLYACCALDDRVLVGGAPHGVAYSQDAGAQWQGAWMDQVDSPVVALAPAPDARESQIVLAGTEDRGVLRSGNNGEGWYVCNFGLHSLHVLHLCWAPPYPPDAWPRWRLAFACTDEGIYRSPAEGRGWRRCAGAEGVFQVAAVDAAFHRTRIVLAGTEDAGLWFSDDKGHAFQRLEAAPTRVNALLALRAGGFLLSDDVALWHSEDGRQWQRLADQDPCLVLYETDDQIWAGGQDGVCAVERAWDAPA